MTIERLPRGFGGVSKMKGNRRRPYRVRIKIGDSFNPYKGTAGPEYKVIGYTKTRKEGIKLLEQYWENPVEFESKVTFAEVYDGTFKEYVEHKSRSSILAYQAAYKACEPLHHMLFKDIKVKDLQKVIDTCGKNYPTLKKIKVLFNQMYKYAMRFELVSKDCSDYVDLGKHTDKNPNKVDRNPFTKKDICIIWKMANDRYYQIILILIYTGVRISELLELRKENIHLEERYFDIIKSKTENGIRRVPIADCIYPFFKNWFEYSKAETLLCTIEHQPFKYRNYYDSYWTPLFSQLDLTEYTPHCTRHTCISLLAEAKVEPTTIKKIVGHRGAMTLTEKTYTHLDVGVLLEAVNKMYVPKEH